MGLSTRVRAGNFQTIFARSEIDALMGWLVSMSVRSALPSIFWQRFLRAACLLGICLLARRIVDGWRRSAGSLWKNSKGQCHPERSSVRAKAGRNAVEGSRGMTGGVAGDSTGFFDCAQDDTVFGGR